MWISKKKWDAMEKRIADLEKRIQGQQLYKKVRIPFTKDYEYQRVLDSDASL